MFKGIIVLGLVSLVGCASTSDIEGLQVQIDALHPKVAQAQIDAREAKLASQQALVKAGGAEAAALKAALIASEVNEKLDRLFVASRKK